STIGIVGANFNGQSTALLDGQPATISDFTKRTINIVIKGSLLSSPGTHTIQVQDKDGNLTNTVSFNVVSDVSVSTLAGGRQGFNSDCVSPASAQFLRPRRLYLGPDGLLYVTDQQNNAVRSIDTGAGQVCTVAGTGDNGYNDSGN